MLMLPVRSIYIDYCQFVVHDSKHILGHEYECYDLSLSVRAKNKLLYWVIQENSIEFLSITYLPYVLRLLVCALLC